METLPVFTGVKSPVTDKAVSDTKEKPQSDSDEFQTLFDSESEPETEDIEPPSNEQQIISGVDGETTLLEQQNAIVSQSVVNTPSEASINSEADDVLLNSKFMDRQNTDGSEPTTNLKLPTTEDDLGAITSKTESTDGRTPIAPQTDAIEPKFEETELNPALQKSGGENSDVLMPSVTAKLNSQENTDTTDLDIPNIHITKLANETTQAPAQATAAINQQAVPAPLGTKPIRSETNTPKDEAFGRGINTEEIEPERVETKAARIEAQEATKTTNLGSNQTENTSSQLKTAFSNVLTETESLFVKPDSNADKQFLVNSDKLNLFNTQQPIVAPAKISAGPVVDQLNVALSKRSNGTVEIQLDPVELGKVKLQISPAEMGQRIVVIAERPEVLDLLRKNEDLLTAQFSEQGLENSTFQFREETEGNSSDQFETSANDVELEIWEQHTSSMALSASSQRQTDGNLDIRL